MAINISPEYKVAIIGGGFVGKAYARMFEGPVIYDEPQIKEYWEQQKKDYNDQLKKMAPKDRKKFKPMSTDVSKEIEQGRKYVNECDIAIVCVPTPSKKTRGGYELDMSIVEDVVSWIDTPLILIKSALQPGTVDRLIGETGKKIAVSVEMVGEGKYFIPFWKYPDPLDPVAHNFIIVGGEEDTARRCADFLWSKMSPDVNIHLTSAIEAEITKLMENTWGAMKVSFANTMYDICDKFDANYTRVLQAWGADGRTEKMHMRVLPHKRGWRSKCYDKDIPALASLDDSGLLEAVVKANKKHLAKNDTVD